VKVEPEITVEISTPKYIDASSVVGNAREDLNDLLSSVAGDDYTADILRKGYPAQVRKLKVALKKVEALRKKIKTILTPPLRDLEKTVKRIELDIEREARGE